MKVVNLVDFKELKETRRCEESYGRYLKGLANSQLEIEVNALLEEFSGDTYGKDFFSKGKLILKEITSRADRPVQGNIEKFTSETLKLI